ncbi:MAG: hypothetical protein U5K55_15600 [Aliarcobacter sp.]|nr:hypothetical protein [Aliarcobacter sp.]
MIISYDDVIYPSLSLESLRIGLQIVNKVFIDYDESWNYKVYQLDDITIPTDRYGRLLVNYRGKEKTFQILFCNRYL